MPDSTHVNSLVEFARETSDKIETALKILAEQLGVGTEYIFEILVKQQMATGIAYLLVAILIIIVFFILNRICKDLHPDDKLGVMLVSFFVMSICVIGFVAKGILRIINPEYYALETIMNFINKMH